jgi:hypothetical protein
MKQLFVKAYYGSFNITHFHNDSEVDDRRRFEGLFIEPVLRLKNNYTAEAQIGRANDPLFLAYLRVTKKSCLDSLLSKPTHDHDL